MYISFLTFSAYQTYPKQCYEGLEYRIININAMICYLSVIILERGSSTIYDSRISDDGWQWLLTEGSVYCWVIDDTKVLCSLNVHCCCSSIKILVLINWSLILVNTKNLPTSTRIKYFPVIVHYMSLRPRWTKFAPRPCLKNWVVSLFVKILLGVGFVDV